MGSLLGNRLCGRELPQPIESKSNVMHVKFRTDYSNAGKGFYATYYASECPLIRSHFFCEQGSMCVVSLINLCWSSGGVSLLFKSQKRSFMRSSDSSLGSTPSQQLDYKQGQLRLQMLLESCRWINYCLNWDQKRHTSKLFHQSLWALNCL